MVSAIAAGDGQLAKSAVGMALRFTGVSMIDGATALTQIPSLTTSSARHWVIDTTAALVAVYATMPPVGTSAGRAATLTIRPPAPPPRRIARTASRHDRKQVVTLSATILL